ncbi:hypothetical protein DFH06DRAFT_483299 [Mycena polygramma]|nr:hypothetical protein DFH06DRAFT_483299 [Mycena polygramma]
MVSQPATSVHQISEVYSPSLSRKGLHTHCAAELRDLPTSTVSRDSQQLKYGDFRREDLAADFGTSGDFTWHTMNEGTMIAACVEKSEKQTLTNARSDSNPSSEPELGYSSTYLLRSDVPDHSQDDVDPRCNFDSADGIVVRMNEAVARAQFQCNLALATLTSLLRLQPNAEAREDLCRQFAVQMDRIWAELSSHHEFCRPSSF